MARERAANRLLDGIVVGLVVTLLGLVAGAPRAERQPAVRYAVVDAPSPACAAVRVDRRLGCLQAARATLER
jgi:hypothetical protein